MKDLTYFDRYPEPPAKDKFDEAIINTAYELFGFGAQDREIDRIIMNCLMEGLK